MPSAPPLSGLRVIDVTTFLSGPFATQMLADLGADIVKVESLGGDSSRTIPPHFVGGDSAYYLTNNRSKRSISLDLKSPKGLAVMLDLIAGADIVIENFRPGVCARLGLDAEKLRAKRPELVWVSISGFGQLGPWKDKPAYDMIVQALSGVMSLTGEKDRPAVRLGIPAGDLVAGMFAGYGALAAYIRRLQTGEGATVDISMLDSQLVMTSYQAVYAMLSGVTPQPQGARHDSIPSYRSFRGGDGREFVVTANTERMWQGLCTVIEREDLVVDERFRTAGARLENKEALWVELEEGFAKGEAAEWVDRLEAVHVPAALIKTVSEAVDDAREAGRGMIIDLDDGADRAISVLGNPVRLLERDGAGWEEQKYRFPPRLSEDSASLMRELGYDEDAINALYADGTVGRSPVSIAPDPHHTE